MLILFGKSLFLILWSVLKSLSLSLFFLRVPTTSHGLKPCLASSKAASYGDISSVTLRNPFVQLMKLMTSFLNEWKNGIAKIIRSLLGFIIPLFHLSVFHTVVLTLPNPFGTF